MSWVAGIWGKVAAGGAILLAVLTVVWRVLAGAKKAGVDQQKAKEADARERDLEQIKRAADAGAHLDPGGMRDDPYNRDRRGKP